ncbi:chemerin-like receptor 1 [Pseudophryne corroboree]|uniref:chemerin-like receptor 1 n=1 Tax=Pseudophryne corroboree TaxID=495146 RepID=UPI003081CB9D
MEDTSVAFDFTNNYETDYSPWNGYIEYDLNLYILVVTSYIFFFVTFILGTIGNGLVIWITGFKMKKTVTTIWFLNLAVADFALSVSIPLQMFMVNVIVKVLFNLIICKAITTLLLLNMSVSTSFLMIISIDRCTSVMCPVWSQNHRTLKLSSVISAVVWAFCFILNSPYLAFMDFVHDRIGNISDCVAIYGEDYYTSHMRITAMYITRFVFMFIIPFSIIIICYSLVTFRLRRSRSVSGSRRPFKVIITIVICFFCFWFPYHLLSLLEIMNAEISENVWFTMNIITYFLCFFNSCVNPIIYVFVGRDFKKILFKSIPFLLESTFRERY